MNQQLKTSPKESTRVGLLIVGIGGNNGSTLATTMLLQQQRGIAHERLYGSVSQSGSVSDASGKVHSIKDVTEPILKDLSEFIAVGGWDVRSDVSTLNDAVHNADVIPLKTQEILSKIPQMSDKTSVMPGVWLASSTFIEKEVREECVFENNMKAFEKITTDIDNFAETKNLTSVVVVYSGSTERNIDPCIVGVNDTVENFLKTLNMPGDQNINSSHLYAFAAASSRITCCFINGAAQNTCEIKAIRDKFSEAGRLMVGNDLATGQTVYKKSVGEYLLSRGVPIISNYSCNALHNHDGFTIANVEQNAVKCASKSNMTKNFERATPSLYKGKNSEQDISIKVQIDRLPGVHPDRKRATDEFIGKLTYEKYYEMYLVSLCPDTQLALGVMIDLVLSVEMMMRLETQLTCDQACALLCFFIKSPETRYPTSSFFSDERHLFTSFLLHLCDIEPVHIAYKNILYNSPRSAL